MVARLLPFQFTVDDDTKPSPFTIIVTPAPPAFAFDGVMDVMLGDGFGTGFAVPPPVDPELPDEQFTSEMRAAAVKKIKPGRKFMDYLQNAFRS